ncbi:MAG: hypothetical protein Q8S57_03970 [Methanoregula sp.]|nr:hypothetical protein [Methanoregula sp.]
MLYVVETVTTDEDNMIGLSAGRITSSSPPPLNAGKSPLHQSGVIPGRHLCPWAMVGQ